MDKIDDLKVREAIGWLLPQSEAHAMTTLSGDSHFPRLFPTVSLNSVGDVPSPPESPCSVAFCQAFESATGWTLGFSESRDSLEQRTKSGLPAFPVRGRIAIDDMSALLPPGATAAHRTKCDAFVEKLDGVFDELQQARQSLMTVKASRAVPATTEKGLADFTNDAELKLAKTLSSLCKAATSIMGGTKATISSLDDQDEFLETIATSEDNANEPQNKIEKRLLSTSLGDLEVMAGNALVISDPTQAAIWAVPEICGSAVCVPISSMTNIYGTLWVSAANEKDYSADAVNLLEIIAGRIACELEKSSMARELKQLRGKLANREFETEATGANRGAETKSSKVDQNEECRIECHPVIAPPFSGWSLEGECGSIGNRFIEWDVTDDEEIRISVGQTSEDGTQAAASVFVDPLTAFFQIHGRVEGVALWLMDEETGEVFDIDEWAQPLHLDWNHSLYATTTDDHETAKSLLGSFLDAANNREPASELVLCLRRK